MRQTPNAWKWVMSQRMKEYLSIVVMCALTVFFYMLTPPEDVGHGGTIFPKVLMGLMAALILVKLVSDIMNPKSGDAQKEGDPAAKANRPRFWVILVSIAVYVFAVDHVGFYVSSFIFFFGLTVAVQYEERTPRSLAIRLAAVTGFMLFLYALFSKILMAQLPKGMIF